MKPPYLTILAALIAFPTAPTFAEDKLLSTVEVVDQRDAQVELGAG